jgi:hypothetical protein
LDWAAFVGTLKQITLSMPTMDVLDALDLAKPTNTNDLIAYAVMICVMVLYFWLIEKYS